MKRMFALLAVVGPSLGCEFPGAPFEIAAVVQVGSTYELWFGRSDGTAHGQGTAGIAVNNAPFFSRRGKYLAYFAQDGESFTTHKHATAIDAEPEEVPDLSGQILAISDDGAEYVVGRGTAASYDLVITNGSDEAIVLPAVSFPRATQLFDGGVATIDGNNALHLGRTDSNPVVLTTTQATSFGIDEKNGLIYWVEVDNAQFDSDGGVLMSAKLDGSDKKEVPGATDATGAGAGNTGAPAAVLVAVDGAVVVARSEGTPGTGRARVLRDGTWLTTGQAMANVVSADGRYLVNGGTPEGGTPSVGVLPLEAPNEDGSPMEVKSFALGTGDGYVGAPVAGLAAIAP